MSWAVGQVNGRWIGYGVPALCDHPDCTERIDRGFAYACGGGVASPLDEDGHCDLFFCNSHLDYLVDEDGGPSAFVCASCGEGNPPFEPKGDTAEWINHMLSDASWLTWRDENPEAVREMQAAL